MADTRLAVRRPRDVVAVVGPEARTYLQGQLSQDVEALGVGGAAETFLLQPAGKVDVWLRVSRLVDDHYVLDAEAGYGRTHAGGGGACRRGPGAARALSATAAWVDPRLPPQSRWNAYASTEE